MSGGIPGRNVIKINTNPASNNLLNKPEQKDILIARLYIVYAMRKYL
jgi:hypothetical protein